ncbi:MAG TPA: hypothetical protein VGO72_07570 [Herminiimonas sp.]|nr:hypothetical protein [Herminiimonas sp.]
MTFYGERRQDAGDLPVGADSHLSNTADVPAHGAQSQKRRIA